MPVFSYNAWIVGHSSITRLLTAPDRFESEDDR
jgi:hypothetical protein